MIFSFDISKLLMQKPKHNNCDNVLLKQDSVTQQTVSNTKCVTTYI